MKLKNEKSGPKPLGPKLISKPWLRPWLHLLTCLSDNVHCHACDIRSAADLGVPRGWDLVAAQSGHLVDGHRPAQCVVKVIQPVYGR